jgi:hypothetical protein
MLAPKRTRLPDLLYLAAVALSLGLTMWLFWPTLQEGLFADDFTATAMLDHKFASPRGPFDLFDFANGTPRDVRALQRLGSLPWWAPSDYRISFLRPLSSALWHLDRALFGRAFWAYHAHSLGVFCLLVIASSVLYRRLLPMPVAALATLMFAVDDSHQFPVVWLSNRGGIYAVLFGVLALLAHLRWRTHGRHRYAVASSAAICIGLLFGEWALPMLAYILAFELLGAEGAWSKRALALLPSLVPSLVFLVIRTLLHYGARGSGAYIDPGIEPLRFLFALVQRVPVFIGDMMWNIPSEWWDYGTPWRDSVLRSWLIPPAVWLQLPSWHVFDFTLGMLGFAAIGLGLRFCHRGLSPVERKQLRWLLLGALGALFPVVGSFPSTRLTMASFLGLAPFFAFVLREVVRRLRALPRVSSPKFVLYYGLVVALLHIQVFAPLNANIQAQVDNHETTTEWVLGAELDPARVANQRVFLLAGNEFTTTFFFAYIWASHDRPLPLSYYPISTSPCAQYVQRTADNELVMRALGDSYLATGQEHMFRSPNRLWREGESIQLDGLRVTAEQVQQGLPGVLHLTFDRSVDDPSYVFLFAGTNGLRRFYVPRMGELRLLPRASGPSWTELDHYRYIERITPLPEMLYFAPTPGFVRFKPPN